MYIEKALMNAAMNQLNSSVGDMMNANQWVGQPQPMPQDGTVQIADNAAAQQNADGVVMGALPGGGQGTLAFPYVAMQGRNCRRYGADESLRQGTVFPALDMPFRYTAPTNGLADTPMTELMAMDFMVDDMGLYLTTHCDDEDAFALYRSMIRAARERRDQYEANNGPLTQTAATDSGCQWLENPWPWEMGGNR